MIHIFLVFMIHLEIRIFETPKLHNFALIDFYFMHGNLIFNVEGSPPPYLSCENHRKYIWKFMMDP